MTTMNFMAEYSKICLHQIEKILSEKNEDKLEDFLDKNNFIELETSQDNALAITEKWALEGKADFCIASSNRYFVKLAESEV